MITHFYIAFRYPDRNWNSRTREVKVLCSNQWTLEEEKGWKSPKKFTTAHRQVSCEACLEKIIAKEEIKLQQLKDNLCKILQVLKAQTPESPQP